MKKKVKHKFFTQICHMYCTLYVFFGKNMKQKKKENVLTFILKISEITQVDAAPQITWCDLYAGQCFALMSHSNQKKYCEKRAGSRHLPRRAQLEI